MTDKNDAPDLALESIEALRAATALEKVAGMTFDEQVRAVIGQMAVELRMWAKVAGVADGGGTRSSLTRAQQYERAAAALESLEVRSDVVLAVVGEMAAELRTTAERWRT